MIYTSEENPKVAVLLAAYNGKEYILEQLDSIKNQTYQNFICYIHDDGSTDGTYTILKKYCNENSKQFKLVEGTPCGGAKKNFFFLLHSLDDEHYIMFCDQDDFWYRDKIRICLNTIKELKSDADEPLCVYSDLEVVSSNLEIIDPSFYHFSGKDPGKNNLKSLLMKNVVVGCTMMINRALVEKSLEINDLESIFMHDWWIGLVAVACGKMRFINQPLVKYRQHHHNVVGAIRKNDFHKLFSLYCSKNLQENLAKKRKTMKRCYSFAAALNDILPDGHKYKQFISELSAVQYKKWPLRVRFFISNGLIDTKKFWNIFFI